MENAAAALCAEVLRARPGCKRAVVACGPGNNGGDGLAAARQLAGRGVAIELFTLAGESQYTGDAAANLERARAVGLSPQSLGAPGGLGRLARAIARCDIIVDALFGTGLARALSGTAARAVALVNRAGRFVVAADVPSGVSADGGALLGSAVRASLTVAFGAPKLCHVLPPASSYSGRLVVADIGIARSQLAQPGGRVWLAEPPDVRTLLPARPLESHKADFGRLAIVAGSRGKAGAAILAARGGLRGGAGLVTVFCAASLESLVLGTLPEAMTVGLPESGGALAEAGARELLGQLGGFDACVAGPGLGASAGTVRLLETLVRGARVPLVLDADALNALSGRPAFLAKRRAATVLTPHPGEAARLLSSTSRRIQADRLGCARALARASRAIVLLKGAHSLVAEPSGRVVVNPTGTPLLATAGSGDVLAGLIGALLAGGLGAREAAVAGAWLHGAAAESLEPRLGDAGLLAHEVADALPGVRRSLRLPATDG